MHIAMKPLSGSSTFTVHLGKSAHRLAQTLCQGHKSTDKIRQLYLTGLALHAVEYYLQCMGFEIDRNSSQSFDPALRAVMDVADLVVVGRGRVECRPVLPGAVFFEVPPDARFDRLGYVAVQLDADLQVATLLGFTATVAENGKCSFNQLQPLEALFTCPAGQSLGLLPVPKEDLGQWLGNVFGQGWQTLEALLGTDQPPLVLSLRTAHPLSHTGVQRAKLIDLGLRLSDQAVVLLVAVAPTVDSADLEPSLTLLVQLHPAQGRTFLPPELELSLWSEAQAEPLQRVQSRHQDNYIQLKRFQATLGESFEVVITYGESRVTESFIVS